MLNRLIRAFIRRPLLLVLGLLLILVAGIQGWQRMPVDLLPSLDVPVVNIITHLPGASPQDVDLLVTRPIESAMQRIRGVHRVASTSAQGISHISIQFDWGTGINDARQLVQARLGQVSATLPQGVVPRLEQIGTTLQEVAGYTITSPASPVALLYAVRYRLIPRLKQIEGVSRIDVLGGEQRAYVVHIRPEALMRLKLRLSDIVTALADANRVDVAGFTHDGGREWLVRADGRIRSLDDLRHIAIRLPSMNRPVLLGEIADVREGRTPKHYSIHGNGKPAVALLVRKQPGASALDVVQKVDAELKILQPLLPPGAKIRKFYDQSEIIARARDEIVRDLWLGAGLVVLVLYLFLGSIRPTLVVALIIPATLLATLAMMQALGLSLNIVTMTALALAIGMIVDDAIIVAENIARHGKDKPIEQAALDGAVEIAGPDASGTFTTLAAFLPLALVGGMAALFMRPFGWTISAALLVSLILSLILVPSLSASRWFASASRVPRWVQGVQSFVEAAFEWALTHRKTAFGAAALLVVAGVALTTMGHISLLPPMDEGSILVEYTMPPGTSLAESDRIGDRLERIALHQPGIASVYRRTGSPLIGYQIEGVNRGELMMKLKPLSQRTRTASEVMDHFRHLYAKFSSMSFLFHHPTQEKIDESFSGLPSLFGVTIYGDNEDTLIKLAGRVEKLLKQAPGISNIINNTKVLSNQLTVRLRTDRLSAYGLRPSDVMQTLQAAGLGVRATSVIQNQAHIPVLLRWQGSGFQHRGDVGRLPVSTPDGQWIPLKRLTDIESAGVPASVTRLNGQRQITLLAEAEGNIIAVAHSVQRKLNRMNLPAGYSASVSGQYPVVIHTLLEFALTGLAAVVLIYLIMVLQFASWRQPLAILAVIPLALAGGLIAVSVTGYGVDVSIGMGALTLIGIAVNNGIVLVDFANRRMHAGLTAADAWRQAIRIRLRPIMMTAATTIASLLPIAFGLGGSSEIFRPFSCMVIGGLLAAMMGTLIVLPALLLERITKNEV